MATTSSTILCSSNVPGAEPMSIQIARSHSIEECSSPDATSGNIAIPTTTIVNRPTSQNVVPRSQSTSTTPTHPTKSFLPTDSSYSELRCGMRILDPTALSEHTSPQAGANVNKLQSRPFAGTSGGGLGSCCATSSSGGIWLNLGSKTGPSGGSLCPSWRGSGLCTSSVAPSYSQNDLNASIASLLVHAPSVSRLGELALGVGNSNLAVNRSLLGLSAATQGSRSGSLLTGLVATESQRSMLAATNADEAAEQAASLRYLLLGDHGRLATTPGRTMLGSVNTGSLPGLVVMTGLTEAAAAMAEAIALATTKCRLGRTMSLPNLYFSPLYCYQQHQHHQQQHQQHHHYYQHQQQQQQQQQICTSGAHDNANDQGNTELLSSQQPPVAPISPPLVSLTTTDGVASKPVCADGLTEKASASMGLGGKKCVENNFCIPPLLLPTGRPTCRGPLLTGLANTVVSNRSKCEEWLLTADARNT